MKGRIRFAVLPLLVLGAVVFPALAASPAPADAASAKLPPLPKEFSGSFDATDESTPLYSDGTLTASADTITLHATNVVFRRSGVGYYTLVRDG